MDKPTAMKKAKEVAAAWIESSIESGEEICDNLEDEGKILDALELVVKRLKRESQ